MALSNGILTAPLTVTEIASCLGVSDTRVKELCTIHPINMWSRKKPVEINSPVVNRATEWWRGDAGDCGIKPPTRVSTLAEVKALYNGGLNGWSYTPSISWGRMLDFDGYYHGATPEIDAFDVPTNIFSGNNIAGSIGTRADDGYSLNMADIYVDNMSLADWYVGIAIFNGDNLVGWIADQKGLGQYEYPTNDGMVGTTYTIVPFYSSVQLIQDAGIASTFMPIPLVSPRTTTIVSASALIAVGVDMALWDSSRTTITFSVVVASNTNNVSVISSAEARLRFVGKSWDDTMEEGEYSYSINLTSLDAFAEYIQDYEQVIPSAYQESDYVVMVKLMSGTTEYYAEEQVLADESEIASVYSL